ncbi:hypothetical protein BC628DRAFT_1321256 [Trametes gibbosa]|nr:hypothetical protein BC628DRAFT_1321256 [Trametes gibbosa]
MIICATCNRAFKTEAGCAQHCRDKGHSYVTPNAPTLPYPKPVPASAPSAKPAVVVPKASSAAQPKTASSTLPKAVVTAQKQVAATSKAATVTPVFECKPCCLLFDDQVSLDKHQQLKHPPAPKFSCEPCKMQFSSAEALSIHLRYFSSHPKCQHCNSAFLDQKQLDMHVNLAHPKSFNCVPCNREVAVADRQVHFRETVIHPKCPMCEEGYLDDHELNSHLSSAHLEFYCATCKRQLGSKENLQTHFLVSPMHPHCALCEVGFVDDVACNMHMKINHPRPPPMVPTVMTMPAPTPATSVPPTDFETPRSTQSSPLVQRPTLSVVAPIVSAVLNEKSELDDDSYETVEASSHVQRAVSEPTLPTASSMGPSSAHDVPAYASRSPTISDQSFDDAIRGRRNYIRRPESESTLSMRSVSTASSHSRTYLRSPIPTNPEVALPEPRSAVVESTYGATESVHSDFASRPMMLSQRRPSISSASASERIIQRVSRTPSRVVETPLPRPVVQSGLNRTPTPVAARTPIRTASSRPLSRVSLLSASRQLAPSPSQKPSTTAVDRAPSSDSEGTVEARLVTPKMKGVVRAHGKSGAVSWHCRSCMQDTCVAPTATVCGHIFCTACILQELAKTGMCPACGKLILLRLHVEAE